MKFFAFVFLIIIGTLSTIPYANAQACPSGGTGIWANTQCAQSNPPHCPAYPTKPCNFCDGVIVVSNITSYLIQISAAITVAMIVFGAIRLMLAGGSEAGVSSGKKIITSAIIGLIIALGSWVIVNTVLHLLVGGTPIPWNQITC